MIYSARSDVNSAMPNTKSAIRTERKQNRRQVVNLRVRRSYKGAVLELKQNPSPENLRSAYKQLDKAAKKRVIAKNKASRLKSRLSKLIGASAKEQPVTKKKTPRRAKVKNSPAPRK